jgi:MFS family permease
MQYNHTLFAICYTFLVLATWYGSSDGQTRRHLVGQGGLYDRPDLGRSVLHRDRRRAGQDRLVRPQSFCWVRVSCGVGSMECTEILKLIGMVMVFDVDVDSAAASIPAALNLIVHIFPGEIEQHVALACFGGAGELANVSGFILGGVLLLASWRWVFWLLPMVCFPMAVVTFFLIPSRKDLKMYQLAGLRKEILEGSERAEKILKALEASEMSNKFDFVGTFLIVAAAVLAIFGLTDGGESAGWQVSVSSPPFYQPFPKTDHVMFRQGPSSTHRLPRHRARPVSRLFLVGTQGRSTGCLDP